MMFNQRKFIADYNASHRKDFNEFFFNRNEDDIVELKYKADQLVYQLYGLTDEEIAIVEGKNE